MTITAYTKVEMNAKVQGSPNPFRGRTWKRSRVNGSVGFWYESTVNRQRDREDKNLDFEALPHNYADHEPIGVLTYHRKDPSRLYLPIKVNRSLGHEYFVDGGLTDDEIVTPWLRVRKEGERQGLDNPVIFRNYLLESLEIVVMDHEQYVVECEHEEVHA